MDKKVQHFCFLDKQQYDNEGYESLLAGMHSFFDTIFL